MLESVQMMHTPDENIQNDGLKAGMGERRSGEEPVRPVSKYDDDIRKAIAGFRAAADMLAVRETQASLQLE